MRITQTKIQAEGKAEVAKPSSNLVTLNRNRIHCKVQT